MAGVLEVRGKKALVVPATEQGLIDAVAFNVIRALLSHGCRVVLAGDSNVLQKATLELLASGTHDKDIQVVHVDSSNLTQPSVKIAVEKAWLAFGGVDLLLCFSTYTGPLTAFLDTNERQIEAATAINLKSVCLFSIALGKKMEGTGIGGSFVFVTSIIGTERGLFPGVAIPGASIAAVNYLTRAMALELGKHKIRVNAIARGLYESDALLNTLSSEALDKEGKRVVPLGRWVNKESDLTSMILYLAADASSFITGTVVFVDGGQSLVRPRMRSFL
ncbi:hypothetical protein GOP47_0014836 [Adiantum capillus-veneris]|uniref:Uncharacterized protein n=1 Tax=Adiantum capillus-veneris TaxID=13818 RepID=A0A9D4ZCJ4_ADICA|nr:hypothetical protein GOP47_0014836 [Adiantum capillus-veneris]